MPAHRRDLHVLPGANAGDSDRQEEERFNQWMDGSTDPTQPNEDGSGWEDPRGNPLRRMRERLGRRPTGRHLRRKRKG